MFTEKLKEVTLANHQQTEKILVGKLKSMRSVQDYITILSSFYGYFGGLEKQIERYLNPSNMADYEERRKTAAIADDIKVLGGTVPAVATGDELPRIENCLQAFGALYVIEGSTLGGQIISKMIQNHLPIQNGAGLSFFNGYGDNMQQMWTSFKELLNKAAMTPADEETMAEAANQTFARFKNWLEK
ncbi:biliverdin-producing heme oxygenase [Mucilaginibacter antarcticus]|uniref:Biliverdin-producing heme oxygenase n=1 Tax=Mucilaginibacter antarcticus TaxID=1855725 RepID=A0ABW5XKE9_9SPHI